jgi:hypothetical protein
MIAGFLNKIWKCIVQSLFNKQKLSILVDDLMHSIGSHILMSCSLNLPVTLFKCKLITAEGVQVHQTFKLPNGGDFSAKQVSTRHSLHG